MAAIDIYNQSGEKTGTVELNPRIFGVVKIKPEVIHQVVVSLQSMSRNVVASTKTRGEIRGGGRKPWQQKGTGRARAGSSRSPLWRGGGITFGPRSNRNFVKILPKKLKMAALFMVLSDKAREEKIYCIDDLKIEAGKTKDLVKILKGLSGKLSKFGPKTLFVIGHKDEMLLRAAKNLQNVRVTAGMSLNILDILTADNVVIMKDAFPIIEKTYLKAKKV